jgi:rhodanese-related sulfurtransferase
LEKREFKDRVYTLLAQVVKAMANPHRLEIIDLLGQSERTVEEIAVETGMSVANASQHLQVLKASSLVDITKDRNYIRYRLANDDIYKAWHHLRNTGFQRVGDIKKTIDEFREKKNATKAISIDDLARIMKSGKAVLLDVRPEIEYNTGHIPKAILCPIEQLTTAIKSFSKTKEYIIYCRGPMCVFADDAVNLLTKKGFNARRLDEGFPDWKLKGFPVEAVA